MSRIDTTTPVLVVYRGGIGALAVARTLGRLGVPVYLVYDGETPLRRSRYWKKTYAWDFGAGDEASLAFLLRAGEEIGGRPVLLTLVDSIAIFIERHAVRLKERFVFPLADEPVVERLANKWDMFALAKQHAIPTPETAFPQSREDVLAFARTAQFPVIMKGADPLLPRAASKEILQDAQALIAAYDKASQDGPANCILQEYIPGTAESVWMCNAYFGDRSECKAIFPGKKLRQVSSTGIASLAVCVPNATVVEQTRRFMQSVGYRGCVGIGWRYDARDGQYKVLDVNARVSGVFRLFRPTNGMDVVRICYLDLTGQPVPQTQLAAGRKWMLEQDVESALAEVRAGRLSILGWIRSLIGVRETHWFAFDDPAPFIAWLRPRLDALRNNRRARRGEGSASYSGTSQRTTSAPP